TPLISRALSQWMRPRSYEPADFYSADGAAEDRIARRRSGLDRLSAIFKTRYRKSIAWGNEVRGSLSDLRFADATRVPFPFMRMMRERFSVCSVVTASAGPKLQDLDGQWTLDVSGSYGLNVAGFDRYKDWMREGWEQVKDLGPVLGPMH